MTNRMLTIADKGPEPFAAHLASAAEQNMNYRAVVWTGRNIQVTIMHLNPGEDIGLEAHPHLDQFLRIESGQGLVRMGPSRDNLTFAAQVGPGDAVMVPAGTWHNLINTGRRSLHLSSVYGPPDHPHGEIVPLHPAPGAEY